MMARLDPTGGDAIRQFELRQLQSDLRLVVDPEGIMSRAQRAAAITADPPFSLMQEAANRDKTRLRGAKPEGF